MAGRKRWQNLFPRAGWVCSVIFPVPEAPSLLSSPVPRCKRPVVLLPGRPFLGVNAEPQADTQKAREGAESEAPLPAEQAADPGRDHRRQQPAEIAAGVEDAGRC